MLGGARSHFLTNHDVLLPPIHTHELLPAGLPTSQRPTDWEQFNTLALSHWVHLGSPGTNHPTRPLVVMGELTPAQAHRPFFLPAHLYPSGLSMTMDEQMTPSAHHLKWLNLKEDHTPHFSLERHSNPNRTKKHTSRSFSLFSSPACLLFLPPWALAAGEKPSLQEGRRPLSWLTTHSPSDAP